MKVKTLAISLLFLIALIVCFQIPIAMASPDIYLKDSPASGVTVNPGKLMDFTAPTRVDPAYLTTSSSVEYYWYSPPYVGTIPGPKAHSFHLYYKADAPTTITVTVYVAVQPDGSGTPAIASSKTYPLAAASTVTHVIIPDVIIIPETKLNGERIKLSLSTEDPITVYFDSIATPSVLNAIPPPPPPAPAPATLLWSDPQTTLDIALSKDGQYVAAVTPILGGQVRFYTRSSGTPIWTWTTGEALHSVAISADGDCVAVGGDLYVYFWKDARSLTAPYNPTWTSVSLGSIERRCLDISDDGNYVVAGGTGERVFYWAGAKGNSGPNISPTWKYLFISYVEAVDLSSDGNYIVAGTDGPTVAYWKGAKSLSPPYDPAWESTEPTNDVRDVAVSDDGDYVAAAAAVDTVYYWAGAKILSDDPDPTWSWGTVEFTSIDMSSDGGSVIAGAQDGVHFWIGARGLSGTPSPSWSYSTAPVWVHDVAINDPGDYMAAANDVGEPYLYFFDNSGALKWSYPLDYEVTALSISSNGGTLAVGTAWGLTSYLISTGFPMKPVGGFLVPVDKLQLLSPWIAAALAALALTVFAVKRRRS